MFDNNTLKALAVAALLYFGARLLASDRPRRFRVIRGVKMLRNLKRKLPILMLTLAIPVAAQAVEPLYGAAAYAANAWQALSVGVGGGGVWVDEGGGPAFRDVEAGLSGAVSLTPHVSIVGSVNYGVDRSYVRGSGGARITATDANDPTFSVGVGISRHYVSEPGSGLDEAAAEAAIGWKPLANSRVILAGLAAYGIDTGRRSFSVKAIVPLKLVSGGSQ